MSIITNHSIQEQPIKTIYTKPSLLINSAKKIDDLSKLQPPLKEQENTFLLHPTQSTTVKELPEISKFSIKKLDRWLIKTKQNQELEGCIDKLNKNLTSETCSSQRINREKQDISKLNSTQSTNIKEFPKISKFSIKKLDRWLIKTKQNQELETLIDKLNKKLTSEACSSQCINREKQDISKKTVKVLIKKKPIPHEILAEKKESKKYTLEFKQKVVSEICSGKRMIQVCKSYGIPKRDVSGWIKKAYAPNLPYNSSKAWSVIDKTYGSSSI
ncbi:MAG: Transposase [Chlamydiota bacterium]|jgi:hypothetical protein|nr:Transposase [Chlamydiota bacterium]